MLQKGFYHRNVNFQSYVDHTHQEFVFATRACVDPPHLRMVFDEAVVDSFTPQSTVPASASRSQSQTDGDSRYPPQSDSLNSSDDNANADNPKHVQPPHHQHRVSDTAADDSADNDLGFADGQQQSEHSAEVETTSRLSGSGSCSKADVDEQTWRGTLQRSMLLAKDTRWTHKGLQVSAVACPSIAEVHVPD